LPGNGIYSIVVKVKSITTNGFTDTSRIGMARGNVVIPSTVTEQQDSLTQASGQTTEVTPGNNAAVPEFGPVASIVLAIAVLSVVVFAAKTRVIPRY
jgi:predicted secreted protein with PEFG-CTERM motif